MIPVVELLRVSTASQAEDTRAGLPSQRAVNARTCATFGLEVIEVVDVVEGGAEVAESPAMARVLELITGGLAQGIVLAEYSRLFRPDKWSDMIVLQMIQDHDALIYLPAGPIDLQSDAGFMQATVNNLFSAMERRGIRARMDRGKEEHRRRGRHVAGGVGIPFGLAYSKAAGWSYTAEAELVRGLFRAVLEGEHNLQALAGRYGLARSTVRFVLQNPVYTGWRVYDERRDSSPAGRYPGGDRRRVKRSAADVIRVRLPLDPIVSEADFAQVQRLLDARSARRVRVSQAREYLYRGMVQCASRAADGGECGHLLYSGSRQVRRETRRYYYCRTRIRSRAKGMEKCSNGYLGRDRLEEVLDGVVADRLTDPDVLTAALEAYTRSLDAKWRQLRPDVARLQQRVTELQRKRDRLLDAYFDGLIDRDERDRRLAPLAGELAAAERAQADEPALPPQLSPTIIEAIVTAFAEWPCLEWDARRRVLEALAPVFYVDRYEVRGVRFPLTPLGDVNSGSRLRTASCTSGGSGAACAFPPSSC